MSLVASCPVDNKARAEHDRGHEEESRRREAIDEKGRSSPDSN